MTSLQQEKERVEGRGHTAERTVGFSNTQLPALLQALPRPSTVQPEDTVGTKNAALCATSARGNKWSPRGSRQEPTQLTPRPGPVRPRAQSPAELTGPPASLQS